jgi:hypothetical protein
LIKQVKAVVRTFGICYLHGDGNMYHTEKDSHFRKNFGNPGQEESKYRVKFEKGDKIPETVEEMNEALMKSRQKEMVQDSQPKAAQVSTTFKVDDEDEEAPDTKKSKGKTVKTDEADDKK